ncbi:hypothetical protein MMC19_001107 [Ptychographa xylographoides]|nr:hypothetical protein [Ptychographa xylographoides]
MDPWVSWGLVTAIGVGAYLYYTKQQQNKGRAGRAPSINETTQSVRRKVEGKTKRKKENTSGNEQAASSGADVLSVSIPSSSNEQAKQRKSAKKKGSGLAKSSEAKVNPDVAAVAQRGGVDDEVDDKEFARQLAGVKAGTSLSTTGKAERPPRTKKQSQANGFADLTADGLGSAPDMSGDSSTTGADADDDLSDAHSPALVAITSGGGGVADMLEAPTPGPSVLRLTEPAQSPRPSVPKQSKSIQTQDTKKQRQRQAKNEARKAELAQSEKDRRVLLEKQLRTAREAEGRPAKNGVPVSKPPTSNPWTKTPSDTASTEATPDPIKNVISNDQLLDTFDDETPHAPNGTQQNIAVKRDAQRSKGDGKLTDHPWMSEEEQMRMFDEMEDNGSWQTVNVKKGVKTRKEDAGQAEEEKPKEQRKGRYLPYENFDHPDNSEWTV